LPRPTRTKAPPAPQDALLKLVLSSLEDDKAEDVTTIPLAGKSSVADYLVIASGRSSRQVATMAQHLREKLKATGRNAPAVEGLERGDWVLVDAGDIVVHLFRPEVRSFYNLEKMWSIDLAPAAAASVAKRRSKAAPKAAEA
jgi:ribosome-associated protein